MDLIDDAAAERLARVAAQLVARVRSDDPAANGRWLASQLPDPADWFRLAFVLAAAVPDDQAWGQLTEWTVAPLGPPAPPAPPSAPCSYRGATDAGANRHRARKEPVCTPCGEAERTYNRARKATYRERPTERTAA